MCQKHCVACNDLFISRANVPNQSFCSKPHCQRERRRRWQRKKLKEDADYRANQAAAQKRWRERNPDYWCRYRQSHPEYTARNREQQRQRNRNRDRTTTSPSPPVIAKMDEYFVEMRVLSGSLRYPAWIAKR
ncbi:MAG: hypothetical protein ABW168_16175 [Sedimenticola sp.]